MDEKKLDSLLTVIESGSLSRAAEKLDYTQPALTQMMNSLERELGCRLLVRGHSGIDVTDEGRRLLPYIKRCAAALGQLRSAADEIVAGRRQVIRIGAYPSITQSWLSTMIKEFQQRYPAVAIQLQVGGYDVQHWLRDGDIDLAFLDEGMRGHDKWVPLQDDPYLAVVPESCPLSQATWVSISQLLDYPLLLADLNELQSLMEQYDVQKGLQIDATDDTSLLSMVEHGLGVTILPKTSLSNLSDTLRAVPLRPSILRTLGAVYQGHSYDRVKTFVNFSKHWIDTSSHLPQPGLDLS